MTERFEELIWAELDGELSHAESQELLELRKQMGPKPQDLEAQLSRLAARLALLEDLPAPVALKDAILGALERTRDQSAGPRREQADSMPKAARYPRRGLRAVRWGLLAAGLVIAAVLVYQFALGPGLPTERAAEVVGTIRSESDLATPSVDLPDFVVLTARDRRLAATLSPPEGSFAFVFRAANLTLERLEFYDGATGTYEAEPGRLFLQVEGPGRAELLFAELEPEVTVDLAVSGTGDERFERTFLLDQLSQR